MQQVPRLSLLLALGSCDALSLSSAHSRTWTACRQPNATAPPQRPPFSHDCIADVAVPGTALRALVENKSFAPHIASMSDLYVATMMDDWVPDIATTGRGFYTFAWSTTFCEDELMIAHRNPTWSRLTLRGVNYRARVWIDGIQATPNERNVAEGMFHRFTYDIPMSVSGVPTASTSATNLSCEHPHIIAIVVEPPDHPGNTTGSCFGEPCGQGGNHMLARDVTSQYGAGWDWVAGTPDRNTGVFDAVTLRSLVEGVALRDATVETEHVVVSTTDASFATSATLRFTVNVETPVDATKRGGSSSSNGGGGAVNVTVAVQLIDPRSNTTVVTLQREHITLQSGDGSKLLAWRTTLKSESPPVRLWWPHTLGEPFLYTAIFSVTVEEDSQVEVSAATASDTARLHVGIRTTSSHYDERVEGRAFQVNGRDIFIEGGNWISADMFLTHLHSHEIAKVRYDAEIRKHANMGLNFIRVWGGGLAERPEFYDACDRNGVFVMQELWMSGDNNGRWAGNFSWPDDHSLFEACAADTVKSIRSHPSLLFFCGGNELYPIHVNPPPDIASSLHETMQSLDPTRASSFIPSSMSNGSTPTAYDWTWALAPKDGPYGVLPPAEFATRNPGMTMWRDHKVVRADDLPIAFQPEIGSTSTPTYASLRRFLTKNGGLKHFPDRAGRNGSVGKEWTYHRHIGYTTNAGEDLLYAYSSSGDNTSVANVSEYSIRAQLALFTQTRNLLESFRFRMWSWYSAVVIWKSQGPWPAMRGALYDFFLADTGGFHGAAAATSSGSPLLLHTAPAERKAVLHAVAERAAVGAGADGGCHGGPSSAVIAAAANGLHIGVAQADDWEITLVNRGLCALSARLANTSHLVVVVETFEVASAEGVAGQGSQPLSRFVYPLLADVPSGAAVRLEYARLRWPIEKKEQAGRQRVVLARIALAVAPDEDSSEELQIFGSSSEKTKKKTESGLIVLARSEYWLSDFRGRDREVGNDYSALGRLRDSGAQEDVAAKLLRTHVGANGDDAGAQQDLVFEVEITNVSPRIAFALTLVPAKTKTDEQQEEEEEAEETRILPAWVTSMFTLLPNESVTVRVEVGSAAGVEEEVWLRIAGWNVRADALRLR